MKDSGKEDRTPVYKKDERHFLYLDTEGEWCVGDTVGDKRCFLFQEKDGIGFSLLPSKTLPWKYASVSSSNVGGWDWMDDDNTLKVFPCYR